MTLVINNDFTDTLLNVSNLGSFYSGRFDAKDQLLALFDSWGLTNQQVPIDLAELEYLSSRQKTLLYHRQYISHVRVFESEISAERLTYLTYGMEIDGSVIEFGNPSNPAYVYRYGIPIWLSDTGYPVDRNIVKIGAIYNRPADPSGILTNLLDYRLEDNSILFNINPFDDPLFTTYSDLNPATNEEEKCVDLWFKDVYIDLKDMQETYGSLLGLYGPNTEAYKRLVNAFWDCIVDCPSLEYINKFIGAVLDCPVAETTETIAATGDSSGYSWVATDRAVYKMKLGTTCPYAIGETVVKGTFLNDTVKVLKYGNYTQPQQTSLTVPKEYMDYAIKGDLTFTDQKTSLVDYGGYLGFTIEGEPSDEATFWKLYHDNCAAKGLDGDQLLQQAARGNSVVPIQFLLSHILTNNYIIYSVDKSKLGPEALDLETLKLIYKIIPPGQTILFAFS